MAEGIEQAGSALETDSEIMELAGVQWKCIIAEDGGWAKRVGMRVPQECPAGWCNLRAQVHRH